MNPDYPVYIVSKGRWETRLTAKALERMKMPYRIVVEPQEFERYAYWIDERKILVLPFANLGQGSIPARNWIWEHSMSEGTRRHWILDDNIAGFCRLNRNKRVPVDCGNIFAAAERFVDRYENVAIAGFQYRFFCPHREKHTPFTVNTRVYSCILLNNSLTHRWRGRYNEDTDLSLRVLKDGWCTVLFYAFLADKAATMTMDGGNTDQLYAREDGRLKMALSLAEQHPDVASVTWKWGRWQHHVDYSGFKQKLVPKAGWYKIPPGADDCGMRLTTDGEDVDRGARAEPQGAAD
jgi:hypothetical protein